MDSRSVATAAAGLQDRRSTSARTCRWSTASAALLGDSTRYPPPRRESAADLLRRADSLLSTAARVLTEGGLHPQAALQLQEARKQIARAAAYAAPPQSIVDEALRAQTAARDAIVDSGAAARTR